MGKLNAIDTKLSGHVDDLDELREEVRAQRIELDAIKVSAAEERVKTKIMMGLVGLGGGGAGAGVMALIQSIGGST